MSRLVLYHNPSCSKSRGAVEILNDRGIDFETIEYLSDPLERPALEQILESLPDAPSELVRRDKNFKELGLDPEAYQSSDAVVSLLLEHPKLMQRPIALLGNKGVIARPSERVLELLDGLEPLNG
jgi:arsenate reductase